MTEPSNGVRSLEVVIPGNPGDAAVNGWKTPIVVRGKARVIEGKRYRAWKQWATPLMRVAARGVSFGAGPLYAEVTAYWPRLTRQGEAAGLPFGDVDAVGKAALDALETAGILVDGQVVELRLRKYYDHADPRITITIEAR